MTFGQEEEEGCDTTADIGTLVDAAVAGMHLHAKPAAPSPQSQYPVP